jgi:hypothetical protein
MALSGTEVRDVSYVPKQKGVTKLIVATSIGNALGCCRRSLVTIRRTKADDGFA